MPVEVILYKKKITKKNEFRSEGFLCNAYSLPFILIKKKIIGSGVLQPTHFHCLVFSNTIPNYFTFCFKYNILGEFHFTVHMNAIQSYSNSISFPWKILNFKVVFYKSCAPNTNETHLELQSWKLKHLSSGKKRNKLDLSGQCGRCCIPRGRRVPQ